MTLAAVPQDPAAAAAQAASTPSWPPAGLPTLSDPTGADALSGLRDIHLPPPVPFWPLAPGWWLLAGLLVLALGIAALLEIRRRRTLAYRANRDLDRIAGDTVGHPDTLAVAAAAALLMRRIVLTRTGDTAAVARTGESWQRFLQDGSGRLKGGMPADIGAFLAIAPYLPPGAPQAQTIDRAELVAAVRRWIRSNA
ncbi:MAG: hypothetical protein B7Z45_07255 [Azorhizobium sp. 12-66-6]|nr:MAG: hypothetical protein B7Z45_07255 [Azorhizobium sp. 12-66-6]